MSVDKTGSARPDDPLDIAIIAHVRHPIAKPFMGGMEAHTFELARGLSHRGHRVRLLASGDSVCDADVVAITPEHYEMVLPWHEWHGTDELNAHLDLIYEGALAGLAADLPQVVHNNGLHRTPPRWAAQEGVAMVSAMHVPPFKMLKESILESERPWNLTTVTSAAQMQRWWTAPPATASVVRNGIDPDLWHFDPIGGEGAVWVGRITPTKAPALAIQAAKRAGVPLTLFGPIEHRDYFKDEIEPLLDDSIRYAGHLRSEQLQQELGRFDLFVFTPMWDEPFGLVAIEAMACGLPVAYFNSGAVSEVVGDCGAAATAGDVDALADAIRGASRIDRASCRQRVLDNFTLDLMLDRFEDLYRRAIAAAPS